MALEPRRHRFTVTEYYQMAEVGIFDEDDRVELIDGDIVDLTPISPPHASCVMRLNARLFRAFSDVALLSVQNPVRLGDYDEPMPDLGLLRLQSDYYASGHPTPEDVFLLIEVADSISTYDRQVKVPLYARSGIPEVWLADLVQDTLTVYRDPTPTGYRMVQVLRRGDQIAPSAFPDRPLAVADILG